MSQPDGHEHTHENGGFDIVLPDFKSDALLWTAVAVAAGYLAYLVYGLIVDSKQRKATQASKPSDEGKDL